MEITDCRDLTSLQTVLLMIMFLQSSAKLSTCYSHIGIALRSAIRMGLHRVVAVDFNPVERETRKRIFWVIRMMDTYVGALLGLPKLLSDEDIDQELPIEVDDEFITTQRVLPMPPGRVSVMAAFNAHARLCKIMAKTVKNIYPVKASAHMHSKHSRSYLVSHAKIREIEQELQEWNEKLPIALRPGGQAPPELARWVVEPETTTKKRDSLTKCVGYSSFYVWHIAMFRCFSTVLFFTTFRKTYRVRL